MVCYMVPLTLFGPLAVTVMRVRVTLRRAGILLPGGSRGADSNPSHGAGLETDHSSLAIFERSTESGSGVRGGVYPIGGSASYSARALL